MGFLSPELTLNVCSQGGWLPMSVSSTYILLGFSEPWLKEQHCSLQSALVMLVNCRSCAEGDLRIQPVMKEARFRFRDRSLLPSSTTHLASWKCTIRAVAGSVHTTGKQKVTGEYTRSMLYAPSKSTSHQFSAGG
jgi:hypothetical protein